MMRIHSVLSEKMEVVVRRLAFYLIVALVMPSVVWAAEKGTREEQTSRYFDSIRHDPVLLQSFLRQMPKGGDLHNHLSGAVYAETFIQFAAEGSLCFERAKGRFVAGGTQLCDEKQGRPKASDAFKDSVLFGDMVDAFSMRDFHPHCDFVGDAASFTTRCESGHDHFFATFGNFGMATWGHTPEMIAEVVRRAAAQNESYLELMFGLDDGAAANVGSMVQAKWEKEDIEQVSDLARNLENDKDFQGAIQESLNRLYKIRDGWRSLLHCDDQAHRELGCAVKVRYLYQVPRAIDLSQVLARILVGFAMTEEDRKAAARNNTEQLVLGLNLVQPEDSYVAVRDFDKQMLILNRLRGIYPQVHLTLHAGELAPGLVPPEYLRDHIYKSVLVAGAERIGHGVDVGHEDDKRKLLETMAEKKVLVEICLTSNDVILGVRGAEHPLKLYLNNKVPVALATDDEGVSRSDMTHEYLRAAQTYDFLQYRSLKGMARMSLEHSFLPGHSLWGDPATFRVADACGKPQDKLGAALDSLSPGCRNFLNQNERARTQWGLEEKFEQFETKVSELSGKALL
jgi:adenosine deaminase